MIWYQSRMYHLAGVDDCFSLKIPRNMALEFSWHSPCSPMRIDVQKDQCSYIAIKSTCYFWHYSYCRSSYYWHYTFFNNGIIATIITMVDFIKGNRGWWSNITVLLVSGWTSSLTDSGSLWSRYCIAVNSSKGMYHRWLSPLPCQKELQKDQ